ncbi:hypothetical protein E1288_29520 [Saccharopolyspora elongata]|uniref:Uncharacterized protein n=1 Tax=Saccharopolyspora elongata TaxID=2530387 RepID=A0A4V2YKG6_9PSEU|nr:hypothetical protein E1288_29520 [Saccharopolyspora elongata]
MRRNFEKRKVSIGTCGRTFSTPCVHEHACVRCSLLRPDSAQRGRLEDCIKRPSEHDQVPPGQQVPSSAYRRGGPDLRSAP